MAKKQRGRKPGSSVVPANETPEQKFVRIGKRRVTNAARAIRRLGTLGGYGYRSTPEQRDKIRALLESELEAALARMERAKLTAGDVTIDL